MITGIQKRTGPHFYAPETLSIGMIFGIFPEHAKTTGPASFNGY